MGLLGRLTGDEGHADKQHTIFPKDLDARVIVGTLLCWSPRQPPVVNVGGWAIPVYLVVRGYGLGDGRPPSGFRTKAVSHLELRDPLICKRKINFCDARK